MLIQPRREWVSIGPKNSHCGSVLPWNTPPRGARDVQRRPPSPQHTPPLELLSDGLTGSGWKICLQMMEDRLITCRAFIFRRRVIATTKRRKREEMHSGDTLNVSANPLQGNTERHIHAQHSKGTAFQEARTDGGFHWRKVWEIQSHSVYG